MNNFRPHHPKSFGGRADIPNPWMSEEEIGMMRRQNLQFHPVLQNTAPVMHSPLLPQSNMLAQAKHFMNPNSCKMSNSNFTHMPNPNIFKPPYSFNESNFPNRFAGDRFSGNSYANLQHKMNDGPLFKDFPMSNLSPQLPKNDAYSENTTKLYSNMRQPQERFSCMQKDQSQFHRKYDNPQMFQGKDFPFSNKELPSQNPVSPAIGDTFSTCNRPNYKAPSLFPAYSPKDNNEVPLQRPQNTPEEAQKNVHQSVYSSDFISRSNTYCDKPSLPVKYPKPDEFPEKSESYQERNSVPPVNEVFPQHNNSPSYGYDKPPFKTTLPSSPLPQDSFKTLESTIASTNSKFSFASGNQEACFQSSNEIPFQRSQSMEVSTHPSTTASRDCLMQTAPFSSDSLCQVSSSTSISSQSAMHQSSKETFSSYNVPSSHSGVQESSKEAFSSFNFESNMNTTDIADLLPGLDAFLKETLNKSEDMSKHEEAPNKAKEDLLKSDLCKSTVPSCAFSDDEWSKHSIPFIGDNQVACNNNGLQTDMKESFCDQTGQKEKLLKFELLSEKPTEVKKFPEIGQPNSTTSVLQKDTMPEKEPLKMNSALEEAIDLLVKCDPIVGLDYITEYKKNISQQGSFPFRCKLCNSAITRPSIIDHIIGSKHRMRYLKTRNESRYEYINSLKIDKSEKDAKIAEAAFQMEMLYGRGHVIVNTEEFQKDMNADKDEDFREVIEEPVFTLDKIPIGFEALSPEHEELDSSSFPLESDLNPIKQDVTIGSQKQTSYISPSTDVQKEVPSSLSSNPVLPGLGSDLFYSKCDLNSISQLDKLTNAVQNESFLLKKEPDAKDQNSPASTQVKRSMSPVSSVPAKIMKMEVKEESVDQDSADAIKADPSNQDKKEFNLDILEALAKSNISSEEEAAVIMKTIDMLMKMLLRYKLQHLSFEKVENLMKSLQIRSPENIEELKTLLNDSQRLKEAEENPPKEQDKLQENFKEKVEQVMPSQAEDTIKLNTATCEPSVTVASTQINYGSTPVSCINISQSESDSSILNITSAPRSSGSVSLSASEAMKNAPDSNAASQPTACSVNSQASSAAGLKPPPFFSWPKNNETTMTSKASYSSVQNNQNMMWTSAYQYSQAQYPQIPYYQPQNYGSNFAAAQSYPSQYPVIPINSMSIKMAQPPPPPPPPPPVNPPVNPPLPPSVPLPTNLPPCAPLFSNQPPPPPLP